MQGVSTRKVATGSPRSDAFEFEVYAQTAGKAGLGWKSTWPPAPAVLRPFDLSLLENEGSPQLYRNPIHVSAAGPETDR